MNNSKEINNEPNSVFIRLVQFIIVMALILISSPVIISVITVLLFNSLVLNKTNDLTDIIKSILAFKDKLSLDKKVNPTNNEIDDEIEDYEIVGLEKIRKTK